MFNNADYCSLLSDAYVPILVNNIRTSAFLDTGSQGSVFPVSLAKELGLTLTPVGTHIRLMNDVILPVSGVAEISITIGPHKRHTWGFFVENFRYECLIRSRCFV